MELCSTCPLKDLCSFSEFETKITVEAAENGGGENFYLDHDVLVDDMGHTEEEADLILRCLSNRTIYDCHEEEGGMPADLTFPAITN